MKKSFKINLFLLFILISFPQVSFAQIKATVYDRSEYERLGKEEMQSKNYEKAIIYFSKIIQKEYKEHDILSRVGLCYFHLKEYEKAKENFRLAILYSNKISSYYSNLAATYQCLEDNEKAFYYARKGLEIEENKHTLFNASSMANIIGRPEEAIKLLDNSLLKKSNDFNKIYAEAYNTKGDMAKSIYYYELFFTNFYTGHSNEEFDYYNQKYHYYKDVINNFVKNVSENNGNENYLSIIDTLYTELTQSNQKKKTIEKTIKSMNTIVSKDINHRLFFKKMLAKTPEIDEWQGEFYVNLYEFEQAINYYEKAIKQNGTREFLSDKDIICLNIAYLQSYATNLDKSLEPKMMQFYIENNNNFAFLETIISKIYEIIKVVPETKSFFLNMVEKTENEKYKNEIKYQIIEVNGYEKK